MLLEHIIKFRTGYDCIKFECKHGSKNCFPGSGGSHGKHGMNIIFVSRGEKGAVQFLLFTGWLPHSKGEDWKHFNPMPADLGCHSKIPLYQGQTQIAEQCEWCDGQPCCYDGSTLNANDAMLALVNGGDIALWEFLDAYYEHIFEGEGKYPTPAEYPAKPRIKKEE